MPDPRPRVLLDPHFRRLDEIFAPEDLRRLHGMADVVWGKDKPALEAFVAAAREEIAAVIAADWRYGPVGDFPRLRAVLEVSGRFPDPERLDYEACRRRGIPVLSCAPAFGPAVAEMALAMTLALARGLAEGDNFFERGRKSGDGRERRNVPAVRPAGRDGRLRRPGPVPPAPAGAVPMPAPGP